MVSELCGLKKFFDDVWAMGILMFFGLLSQLAYLHGAANLKEGDYISVGGSVLLVSDVDATLGAVLDAVGWVLCFCVLIVGIVLASPKEFYDNMFDSREHVRKIRPIMAMRTIGYLAWTVGTIVVVKTSEYNPISDYLIAVCMGILLSVAIAGVTYLFWDDGGTFRPVWMRKRVTSEEEA